MDYSKLEEQARKLHNSAKDGSVKIDNVKYDLKFSRPAGVYIVTLNGEEFLRLNFRRLKQAIEYLREYMSN